MVQEKNMIKMEIFYMKEIYLMEKEMEREKNIMKKEN